MILRALAITAVVLTLMTSCTGDVYNSFVALPNIGWGSDSLAVFRTEIDDATKAYDITFQVRNENNYKYANLWLFVDVVSPDGEMQRDTCECVLARPDGSWLGGGWGSLYTMQCPYRLATRFAKPGAYTFRIGHGMRDDDIRGIHSIGLRIKEAEVESVDNR